MGTLSNQEVINKGRTFATGQTNGMLNPEQSETFMKMVFDDSTFLGELNHQMRRATKGTIEKLGIGRRVLRPKAEGEMLDQKDWAEPILGAVPYSTEDMTLMAEVTEKFIRENIEKEGFEDSFMAMIAKQIGVDLLDLVFNGDKEAIGEDAAFLNIVDGFIKQLKTGANTLDAAILAGGDFTDDIFTTAVKVLPSKYFNPASYRWIANPKTYITWIEYLKQKETTAGDMAILSGENLNPLKVKWAAVPNFPENKIILADPKNLTIVNTYDIKIRKTTEGVEAIGRDTRYYAVHLDVDAIILEKEAITVINNVPTSVKAQA